MSTKLLRAGLADVERCDLTILQEFLTTRELAFADPCWFQSDSWPQDRLVYAPTFEAALTELFGGTGTSAVAPASAAGTAVHAPAPTSSSSAEIQNLIAAAAQYLADYQRLTAEGKLGEAGQKLEQSKRTLDELNKRSERSAEVRHARICCRRRNT